MIGARSGTIGVGLDAGWIAAAQCARRSGGIALQRAVVIQRPDPSRAIDAQDWDRLAAVLERRGFVGSAVSLVAPDEMVASAVLDLPPRSSGAPVDKIAQGEMARLHGLEPDGFAMGSWDLPRAVGARAESETAVLALACKHAHGQALGEQAWSAGLELVAIDARCAALARACEPMLNTEQGQRAVLDLGWSSARLVVVHEGTLVYERGLPEGSVGSLASTIGDHFTLEPDLARVVLAEVGCVEHPGDTPSPYDASGHIADLIIEWTSALGGQVATALGYAAHRYGTDRATTLLLTGASGQIRGLAAGLGAHLGSEARIVAPSDLVAQRPGIDGSDPRLTAALGSALRFDR